MRLRIEKPIYGGAGLARHEGKAIFVAEALPGELVEAELKHSKASYSEASVRELIEASAERVQPVCQHYRTCGGCHYQHASRTLELAMKKTILTETLTRARITALPEIQTIAAEPIGYRNRIRLHVRTAPFALGYLREQSHTLLPIEQCTIAAPILVEAMRTLSAEAEAELAGWANEIELFTQEETREILLSVYASAHTQQPERKLASLWQKLQSILPSITGCTLFVQPEGKGFAKCGPTLGAKQITYRLSHSSYRVSAGSFFQVNQFLLESMLSTVCSEHQGAIAWDLYAGVGLFTLPLSERFEQVVAVEAAPGSIHDLRQNAPKAETVTATTLDFLRRTARTKSRPDLIVVDPPRAGLGQEATKLLAKVGAGRITYVSCDPTTLARDLAQLLQSGYRMDSLHLIDMFPETFHMETVVGLSHI